MHEPGQTPVQQSPIARIYGEIVYWCTIIASILVIISTTCAFLGMHGLFEPAYLFSSIWGPVRRPLKYGSTPPGNYPALIGICINYGIPTH